MKFFLVFSALVLGFGVNQQPDLVAGAQVIRNRAPASSQTLKDFYRAIRQITGDPQINGAVRLLG